MKVLVTSYCGALKASELNKTCLTALLLFFSQEFNRQNPLRASMKMKGNGCSLPAIKHYTYIMIDSITYCLFLLETCLN